MQQPIKTTCRGHTIAGHQCTRTSNLNANGYCHQHARDDEGDHQMHEMNHSPEIHDSPENPEEPDEKPHDNNAPAPPLPAQDHGSVHLVRCAATSRSTNQQCKNHVGTDGEKFCGIHGGAKKGPVVPLLPQCRAIAKLTRAQCSKRVSVVGEQFCPQHKGKAKSNVSLVVAPAPQSHGDHAAPPPSSPPTVEHSNDSRSSLSPDSADIPWAAIQAQTIGYLVDGHQHNCECTPANRCQTMQSIRMMSSLAASGATAGLSDPPSQETIARWIRSIGQKSDPTKFWQLSMYQLVVASTKDKNAAKATGSPLPSGIHVRMPSGLDSEPSFLNP